MRTNYTLACTPRPPSLDASAAAPPPEAGPDRLTSAQAPVAIVFWAVVLYGCLGAGWAVAGALAVAMVVLALPKPTT
jgi:hypothetical protein